MSLKCFWFPKIAYDSVSGEKCIFCPIALTVSYLLPVGAALLVGSLTRACLLETIFLDGGVLHVSPTLAVPFLNPKS